MKIDELVFSHELRRRFSIDDKSYDRAFAIFQKYNNLSDGYYFNYGEEIIDLVHGAINKKCLNELLNFLEEHYRVNEAFGTLYKHFHEHETSDNHKAAEAFGTLYRHFGADKGMHRDVIMMIVEARHIGNTPDSGSIHSMFNNF